MGFLKLKPNICENYFKNYLSWHGVKISFKRLNKRFTKFGLKTILFKIFLIGFNEKLFFFTHTKFHMRTSSTILHFVFY